MSYPSDCTFRLNCITWNCFIEGFLWKFSSLKASKFQFSSMFSCPNWDFDTMFVVYVGADLLLLIQEHNLIRCTEKWLNLNLEVWQKRRNFPGKVHHTQTFKTRFTPSKQTCHRIDNQFISKTQHKAHINVSFLSVSRGRR